MESFKGNVTTGNIAEFIIYVNMLTWPVASVGWVTSIIQRAEASMERINQFLESDVEIINETTENTSIERTIIFKDVSFTYPDTGINALKNINFNINDGETLGIFGRTGSGKSTIAHLICRIYDVDQGEIRFGDTNIKYLNLSDLRRSIGYVPQDGFLFSGTIKENICFGRDKEDKGSIMTSAQIAEISEEIKSFPDQYDTIVGERGVQLSGGQKQRLSIARAIYIDPKIYIFDDALSSVDANKEKSILEKIYNKTQSKINIIISHRTSAIRNATKIIVLDDGKILESGTHEELISSPGFYAEMHKEQTTNDPKIIEKLKANNRNDQWYYNTHFTPFENFLIAQGESAGEVYGYVYGNHYVTPEQRKMAKEALHYEKRQYLRANQGIDNEATMYLEKLKKGERR